VLSAKNRDLVEAIRRNEPQALAELADVHRQSDRKAGSPVNIPEHTKIVAYVDLG
jgi:predicted transcriptional regulator